MARPPIEPITLGRRVGAGSFGIVHMLPHKIKGKHAVIKRPISNSDENRKLIDSEYHILKTLVHKHIIAVLGVKELSPNSIGIILEYAAYGTLLKQIKSNSPSLKHLVRALTCLADALCYLHDPKQNVIHMDLKAENIMRAIDSNTEKETIKLIDFGFAQKLGAILTDALGTPKYIAPEVITASQDTPYHTMPSADVFSFGILLAVMANGSEILFSPLLEASGIKGLTDAVINGVRPQLSADTPGGYVLLAQSCWQDDPSKRPPMITVYEELQKIALTL
ncbi:MAG: hypothetical protein COB66_08710 [Coxiella sp. (in: Bacteria)]|nr:MAG: hypothetical protein COB66_08710 [Coxiella sp. (in: g-proteobacteria)]